MARDALPSDAALVEYLLGMAEPEDVERLDNLSVSDAAFGERLRAIEHDLADAYVRGELSAADRQRWEARYLASQHGRDDLALARALAEREAGDRRSDVGDRGTGVGSRGSVGRVFRPGTWWSLAAAAVLALALIGGYRIAHREQTSSTIARQPPVVTPPPSPTPAPPAEHVVALTLLPAVRSIAQPPTLTIPSGTTEVRLTLRLEADDYRRYAVSVRDLTANTIAWHSDPLRPTGGIKERSLVVTVPASTFQTRHYLINVIGETTRATEIAGSYPLLVVVQ